MSCPKCEPRGSRSRTWIWMVIALTVAIAALLAGRCQSPVASDGQPARSS